LLSPLRNLEGEKLPSPVDFFEFAIEITTLFKAAGKKIISLNRRPSVVNRNSGSTFSTINATKRIANF